MAKPIQHLWYYTPLLFAGRYKGLHILIRHALYWLVRKFSRFLYMLHETKLITFVTPFFTSIKRKICILGLNFRCLIFLLCLDVRK